MNVPVREAEQGERTAGAERTATPVRSDFWKDALRRRMLAIADVLAVLGAAAVAGLAQDEGAAVWVAASAPLWVVLAKLRGLYDRDHVLLGHTTLDEASSLFHWVAFAATATGLVVSSVPGQELAVGAAIAVAATAFVLAFSLRVTARALWRRLVPPDRGLVVGSGRIAEGFARRLELESGHHLELVGELRLPATTRANGNGRPEAEDWEQTIAARTVERVIFAAPDLEEETLAAVVSGCRALGVKLSVAPPIRPGLGTAVELGHLAELPVIEFRTWDPSRSTMMVKRGIDVVGAAVGLVLLAPLLAVVALAIRLDSPGPALFRQRRVGRGREPFEILKFRTMHRDATERLADVLNREEMDQPVFKLRADPRVTRIGRLLRRTSLDELPQVINVLRGEMSLVGPRPEEAWLVQRYTEADQFRFEMRPGMTGPMQVSGRGELTFEERTAVEREYVENYSLRKDLRILLKTSYAVLGGRGAF